MTLSLKGLAFAFGVLWGAFVFFVGMGNLLFPGYGAAFLEVPRSIYPGFAGTEGFLGVMVGTLYALLDGAVAGLIFGWVYNLVAGQRKG